MSKKILSIVLAVAMLMSVLAVGSYAYTGDAGIEVTDSSLLWDAGHSTASKLPFTPLPRIRPWNSLCPFPISNKYFESVIPLFEILLMPQPFCLEIGYETKRLLLMKYGK